MRTVALLMAGGTGTRLYPASRRDRPKQFLALDGDRSLLRRTADRVRFADETYAVTRERYADRVADELPEAGVLVEPAPKDTGPALVYAAHRVREQVGDCVLVCLPTDHRVDGGFADTAREAVRVAAETDGLVALGLEPDGPETGYGYLDPGPFADGYAPVERFVEKPDAERARELVEEGCLWNAGMFAWRPDALLSAAADSPLAPLVDALADGDPAGGFAAVEPASVDRAVMERADETYVVPAAFDWDDLGTWSAVGRRLAAESGNAVAGDVLAVDAADNVVVGDGAHVAVAGVEGLVVAAYDDRVLVVPADESERVRDVVARLDDEGLF